MSIKSLPAIDVHAHYGTYLSREGRMTDKFRSADIDLIIARAVKANTRITILSPLRALMSRNGADPVGGNDEAVKDIAQRKEIRQWVVVDPLKPATFDQAAAMLEKPSCVGIKIHPEKHGYPISEHGREIFEFAAQYQTVIKTHSGESNSFPQDYVPFANDFPEVTLILSHLGCGFDGDPTHQVRAVQAGRKGNIFTDTSSAQSIMPNLIEWAVREIGAERILYGSDSPCYFAPMQRARIDCADISEDQKRQILCGNAENIFKL